MSNDSIALFWYLRDHHPDADVRAATRLAFDAQVEASGFAHLRPTVREALVGERGTVLEPFVLEESDIDDACDLFCLAAAVDRRLTVISRDKLRPMGGLDLRVKDDGVATRLRERRADRDAGEVRRSWRFAPGLAAPLEGLRESVSQIEAAIYADDRGFVIRYGPLPGTYVPAYNDEAPRIVSVPPLTSVPRWRSRPARVGSHVYAEMWPATPEDAIQVTALLTRHAAVGPTTHRTGLPIERLGIVLSLPERGAGEPTELPAIPVLGSDALGTIGQWLLTDNVDDVADRFDLDLMADLARWFGVAPDWAPASVNELLL